MTTDEEMSTTYSLSIWTNVGFHYPNMLHKSANYSQIYCTTGNHKGEVCFSPIFSAQIDIN